LEEKKDIILIRKLMEYYYKEKLAAKQLRRCYEMAPPRVQQYLRAEVNFVLSNIRRGDLVLDLGCGYGRVIPQLAGRAGCIIGIDNSFPSLLLGKEFLRDIPYSLLLEMDAVHLAFSDNSFDIVICIQNGISAFHVDQSQLIGESVRVAKPQSTLLFSTYSEKFWRHRLEWFERQAEAGLLGEIDYEKTGNGVIVCRDGFKATTVSPEDFLALASRFNVEPRVIEVDESSLFCKMTKRK
jgi:ubiquinone/menaquinone biosynthesis C-methylase UbiE